MTNSKTPKPIRVALIGAPNCGKTSLFNAFTGGRAKVANYPGVTVEYSNGSYISREGQSVELLDLPGVYGDCGHSADERVTIDALRGDLEGERQPDAILMVLDAAHVRTHLHNVLQAKNYGLPMVLVLNMMDMANRDGVTIDVNALQKELDIPVITSVAVRTTGREALKTFLSHYFLDVVNGKVNTPKPHGHDLKTMQAQSRVITKKTVRIKPLSTKLSRLDDIVLHPIIGPLLLLFILFAMFQAVFTGATPAMDYIDGGIGKFGAWVGSYLPNSWMKDLLVDGIISGVGAVLVFLPQILILFAFILALELSGYMARAAFLVDALMAKIGLNGRAFIPLLSSFACAIPGIMAARTIENERDRITTILVAPLMTCAARLPVYVIIIAAFIPAKKVGIFSLQGIVMFGLYLAGIIFALLAAYILKRTVTKGPKPPLLLELPSYKIPQLKDYFLGLWQRAMIFIRRAGRIILPASIIVWFLSTYPKTDAGISETFAGYLGRAIQPILAPIGFNLEMSISLIPAMAAREIAVSTLSIVYGVQDAEGQSHLIQSALASDWSLPMALAFLAWFVFAPQCLSTLAVTRRETNSWRWPLFMFGYLFALAYIAAGLTYWFARLAGL